MVMSDEQYYIDDIIYIPGIDFKHMPPCRKVLLKKIKRTHCLTAIIKNARESLINIELTNDWYIDDYNKLSIQYFDGNPYPDSIADITTHDDEEEENCYVSESDDDDYYNYESDN